ncbi:fimbrial protein [Burkholderia sp. SRS-W-2-2016]|uniref:fimbrial protein n=1 Tax=Burkholderia sp. SRS-W-2-2016 TaxID=1926878 RepID=UPI00094B2474|nr:fimbrial protein [Burkholderia sp. SRS-W-2-2016]OLL28251.1 fimbrial protein [Burkholderia sp. SRS-W-2-2016]
MKKAIIAMAVFAAATSSAFAQTAPANPGQVKFTGEIVAGACGIDAGSLDQVVPLGQVPAHDFVNAGDRSKVKTFPIVLTDCDTATAKNAYFTFTGTADLANNALFATQGSATNVGIRLQTASGEYLANGSEQKAPIVLSNGNNTVQFGAMYEATAAGVTPGEADSVANFTIRYL